MNSTHHRGAELLRAIEADPDGIEPYRVYGDWLHAQGHPRGELIAVQHKLQCGEGSLEPLRAREAELLSHRALLGELASLARPTNDPFPEAVQLDWHLGFVRSLRLNGTVRTLAGFAPDDAHRDDAVLAALLPNESFHFLRSLAVAGLAVEGADGAPAHRIAPLADVIANAELPPTLRTLELGFMFWDEETRQVVYPAVEPVRLLTRLSGIEHLTLHGDHVAFRRVRLPALRTLDAFAIRFNEHGGFWRAPHARLRRLVLSLGQSPMAPLEVEWLVAGLKAPRLEHLGLLHSEAGDRLADVLLRTPIVRQLRVLDLSFGTLTDEGARVLAAHAAQFENLERLAVEENYIGPTGRKVLEAAFPQVVIGHQEKIAMHKGRTLPPVALVPRRIAPDVYDQYSVFAREQRAFEAWSAGDVDHAEMHHRSALLVARATGHWRKVAELTESLSRYRERARQRARPRR